MSDSASFFASRRFTSFDQMKFAALSGDSNPMHMDSVAARRTQAGACVVHGVQVMLWALEQIATVRSLESLASIDADFAQFLYVDEDASLFMMPRNEQEFRAEITIGATKIARYVLKFGERKATAAWSGDASPSIFYACSEQEALALDWEAVAAAKGVVQQYSSPASVGLAYPMLAAQLGAGMVCGLLSLTRLVGMVSPGLHSIFHRISVALVADEDEVADLHFKTDTSDPRFALSVMKVRTAGLSGTIRASRRQPPSQQPGTKDIAAFVTPDAFTGHRALVIGASRGLGEVAAKILAAGGADVTITYAQGQQDAERVVQDIRGFGGKGEALRLDVLSPLAPQFASLGAKPSSLYYFATPRITTRVSTSFSPDVLARFLAVYVEAFDALCMALAGSKDLPLRVFYPSSVFVEQPTRGMVEYAMAKAAGETLCANHSSFTSGLDITAARLPRLLTDQTASMFEQDFASAVHIMLPFVESV
ncbi:MAG: hypothetical protein KGJ73_12455, partial [Rhodospirillales bacterium]|nr:hypothetical protein [Rhodospirillales bacterium]